TMAETATERELQNDIEYLTRLWSDLTAKSGLLPVPSLIYQDLNLAQRVLRDMATEESVRILVDSRETYQRMLDFAQQYTQTIVIDFIDMENADHRAAVLAEFNKALDRDRTRLTVNGFTQLGLVEMTRKRTRESLAHVLCEPCVTCGGRGELRTAQTVCYEIL